MPRVVTSERFVQGLTLDQYIAQMTVNQERLAAALARASEQPADRQVLQRLGHPRKLMVITEDWCGTSLAYVPHVASLLAADPTLEVRVFRRDENPDVMDQYLKRGLYRSIPVFVFFDDAMHELARFIEERPG
jgi:thioredoxin family protein